jgi:hypothetical protein
MCPDPVDSTNIAFILSTRLVRNPASLLFYPSLRLRNPPSILPPRRSKRKYADMASNDVANGQKYELPFKVLSFLYSLWSWGFEREGKMDEY